MASASVPLSTRRASARRGRWGADVEVGRGRAALPWATAAAALGLRGALGLGAGALAAGPATTWARARRGGWATMQSGVVLGRWA